MDTGSGSLTAAPSASSTPPPPGPIPAGRTRRWLPFVLVGALVVVGAAVLLWLFATPRLTLNPDKGTLAGIQTSGLDGSISSVQARVDGRSLSVRIEDGHVVPTQPVAPGSTVTVRATLREPGWISWLAGASVVRTVETKAAAARLVSTSVDISPGHRLVATFDVPVSAVSVAAAGAPARVLDVSPPAATVALPTVPKAPSAGEVTVAAVPDPWERFPTAQTMTYLAADAHVPLAYIPDGEGSPTVSLSGHLEIVLSQPVTSAFASKLPVLTPTVQGAPEPKGTWSTPAPNTLLYTPSAPTFWPGEQFTLTFPRTVEVAHGSADAGPASNSTTIESEPGSILRLQQLLATLDYLPVSWTPGPGAQSPSTLAGQAALAGAPQPGSFSWRWPMPPALTSQWAAGTSTVITTGAIMSFEDVQGLNYSGTALGNPLLWPTLLKAVVSHEVDPRPYVWIEVTKSLPESLWLWSNGQVVLSSLANTGIASTPTTDGTYPVYLRFAENYMSGFNPTGSSYHDLVHWIAYFHGGQAVHGFVRASYGFPQSLGCVELPVLGNDPVSEQVWGYDHIGTLVTVLAAGTPTGAPPVG